MTVLQMAVERLVPVAPLPGMIINHRPRSSAGKPEARAGPQTRAEHSPI
jgi:hypothetical protein